MVQVINNAVDEEHQRQINEVNRENRANAKLEELETRFSALTTSQQQSAEVIDARDGEASLKARLDRDVKKPLEYYENVEGNYISTDSNAGYLKDVEILGNTIQNEDNLEDIRSVGDKVEGQELYEIPVLSCGKNLCNGTVHIGKIWNIATVGAPLTDETLQNGSDCNATEIFCIKPSTEYIAHLEGKILSGNIKFYDRDKKYISQVYTLPTISPNNAYYCTIHYNNSIYGNDNTIQLEEGTVATPYEPYQEDKLTILSPVQLEKVGDVADIIICKDGVWGVEKNIGTVVLNGTQPIFTIGILENTTRVVFKGLFDTRKILNDYGENTTLSSFPFVVGDYYTNDVEHYYFDDGNTDIICFIDNSKHDKTSNGIASYLSNNNQIFKYQPATSTFIPLPHDQQVKLRTFANKTNISFLTEIEGTIKAQVPKSIGATVNIQNEQISNLNKELDRVKKLEESTVSTVETESDFTVVEATSNGYFEDVKLEGKTLANIVTTYNASRFSLNNAIIQEDGYFKLQYGVDVNSTNVIPRYGVHLYKPNTTYTVIVDIKENTTGQLLGLSAINSPVTKIDNKDFQSLLGMSALVIKTRDDISLTDNGVTPSYDLYFGIWKEGGDLSKHITFRYWVLEGDHTKKPPSYFEGVKSVGDGTDEIIVSSVKGDGNLVIDDDINLYTPQNNAKVEKTTEGIRAYNRVAGNDRVFLQPFRIRQGSKVTVSFDVKVDTAGSCTLFYLSFLDANFNKIINTNFPTKNYTTSFERLTNTFDVGNASYIRIELVSFGDSGGATYKNIMVSNHSKPYTPHQSDKKRLLYYNPETQTWEKTILREWDSVKKHADGKYYYHQRSREIVLNGSEEWTMPTNIPQSNTIAFITTVAIGRKPDILNIICDKFNTVDVYNKDEEGIRGYSNSHSIMIRINKSKLSTQDVAGLKAWLQANNVTVVYQLAEEKVYECTNIDLITYANETNYIVESGAITPKSILKVHSNIANVINALQKKVSVLESNYVTLFNTITAAFNSLE